MMNKRTPAGNGLTSLTPGFDTVLGPVEDFRPRRIAIAGVRFATGATADADTIAGGAPAKGTEGTPAQGDAAKKAADDKAAADAAAAEANKGKTPEQIAAEKKTADDAAAAAEAAKGD